MNKINADLAAANKAVTDFTAAANAAKPLMDAAKAEVDKVDDRRDHGREQSGGAGSRGRGRDRRGEGHR